MAVAIDEPGRGRGETKQHQSAILEAQQQRKGREGGKTEAEDEAQREKEKRDTKARTCGANE